VLLECLSVHETLATCRALVGSISSVKIGVISKSAFLSEPFPADVTRVGALPGVDPHVTDKSVVNGKLTLTNLTTVGLLIRVGAVVERQLVLFVEAGRTLVALKLSLRVEVEMLDVLFLIEEAFPALAALVGFDTVNTDHVGSQLTAVAKSGITMLAVVFSFVEETAV